MNLSNPRRDSLTDETSQSMSIKSFKSIKTFYQVSTFFGNLTKKYFLFCTLFGLAHFEVQLQFQGDNEKEGKILAQKKLI